MAKSTEALARQAGDRVVEAMMYSGRMVPVVTAVAVGEKSAEQIASEIIAHTFADRDAAVAELVESIDTILDDEDTDHFPDDKVLFHKINVGEMRRIRAALAKLEGE